MTSEERLTHTGVEDMRQRIRDLEWALGRLVERGIRDGKCVYCGEQWCRDDCVRAKAKGALIW